VGGALSVARLLSSADSSIFAYLEDNVIPITFAGMHWVTSGSVSVIANPQAFWASGSLPGRARVARQRDRFYFTTWSTTVYSGFRGVVAIDAEGATTSRMAGLSPPAYILHGAAYTTNAQVMAIDTAAAWRALIRRTASDGYELVSAPTYAMTGYTDTLCDGQLKVGFPMHHSYVAGDVCELYRTVTVTPADTNPGDVMYLAVSQVITSTDITNGYIVIRDNCPDAALGVALYTNEGEEGAEAANLDPPASSDMVSFKGHMFYAATALPAKATVGPRVAYSLLSTDTDRIYGVGFRATNGTYTNGNPTVTAVVNMRGIVPGQWIFNSNVPGGTAVIISVTATTFTMDKNASASAAGSSTQIYDIQNMTLAPFITSPITFLYLNQDSAQFYAMAAGVNGSPFTYTTTVNQRAYMPNGSQLTGTERGVEFVYRVPRVYEGLPFTLRATNGVNYSPPLPEYNATANSYSPDKRENRVAWSKHEQPEAVPPLNFSFVGSGVLYRMVRTRDALWLFCSDGLYRLSGDGGDGPEAWRIDSADPNLVLASRNAVATLKDTVWAYTNRGLVAISDEGGIQDLSLGVIGDQVVGANFSDTWDVFMEVDQLHQEVWLTFRTGTMGSGSAQTFIFNAVTKTFVDMVKDEYSTAVWAPYLQSMVLAKMQTGLAPALMYFETDTSSTRMAGADVRYQPLFAADPFMLKQFQSVTMMFDGMNASNTLTPNFSGTDYTTLSVNQSSGESRCTIGVPRNAPAIAGSLRPGFKMGSVAAAWSFRGLSAQFADGGEDTERD
jgi:hypothetical protein